MTPSQWRYAAQLLTEVPLAFLLAAATVALVRAVQGRSDRWCLAAGACSGLALLCKPNVALAPAILAAAALLGRRSGGRRAAIRAAAAVLLAAMVVALPWIGRNWMQFGRPFFSTVFEDNIARVSAVATLASVRGEAAGVWSPRWEAIYLEILDTAQRRYGFDAAQETRWTAAEELQHTREVAQVAGEIILRHPGHAAATHLRGVLRSWTHAEFKAWYPLVTGAEWPETLVPSAVSRAAAVALLRLDLAAFATILAEARSAGLIPVADALWVIWLGALFVSAVTLGAGLWWLRWRVWALALLAGLAGYLLFLPGPIAYERFRVPAEPLLASVRGIGLAALAGTIATRRLAPGTRRRPFPARRRSPGSAAPPAR